MKRKIVRKSNALIEASFRLSAQEQWVILFLTSMIQIDDEDFKDYTLPVKEFAELAGIRHKGEYEEVKEITRKLIGRVFTINEPSGSLQLAWLSSAKYLAGKGTVTLRFDPGLKKYLLQLKERFTRYNLHQVIQLKSSFSIRIYELLKQYENIKERSFLIKDLRKILGIESSEYPKYGNLKQRVLMVAQKEIGEKTDISFDYEEIKVGRSVGKVRFIIKPEMNQKTMISPCLPGEPVVSTMEEKTRESENLDLLRLLEIVPAEFRDKETIKTIVQTAFEIKGFDYVLRNIIYSNENSNAVKPGSNPEKGSNYRVYLSKSLQKDFGLAYQEDLEVKKEIEEKSRSAAKEEELKKNAEKAVIMTERENREKARLFMQNLAPEILKTFEMKAETRLSCDALARVKRGDSIGRIELKRKLEEVVMEFMGIGNPPVAESQPEQTDLNPTFVSPGET